MEKSKVRVKHFHGKYHEAYLQVSSVITRLKSLDYDVESFLDALDYLLKHARREGQESERKKNEIHDAKIAKKKVTSR